MKNHQYKMLHDSGKLPLVAPEWFVIVFPTSMGEPLAFFRYYKNACDMRKSRWKNAKVYRVKTWVKLIKNG